MNKISQAKLGILLVVMIFLSLIVIAANITVNETFSQLNESENQSLNQTIALNTTLNESNVTNEQVELNITGVEINSSENEDSFEKAVEANNFKLNDETKQFLASADKNEQKQFIIKFKPGFDKGKLAEFSDVRNFGDFKVSSFESKVGSVETVLSDDYVEKIELDQNLNLLSDTVPFNVRQVGADSAWNLSEGSGVKVAVLDTGVSLHDDLSVSGGWNVVGDDSDYSDSYGHGTMVAGVLSALLNGAGLVGVAPNVSLYAIKVMDGSSGSLSDAIAGVEWAIDNNMNIVSMSFGFDSYSEIFKDVLEDAYGSGILLVGASGNNGDNQVLYPAAYSSVIAVGAVDENNKVASFSNYGFELELVAPGVDINSTSLDDGYDVASGTSLAVPHVAGVAALVWSYNRSLSNEQVRAKLRNDALDLGTPGKDDYYGYDLVMVNLSSENYNYSELSYYYEVFNISDFGLDNESYSFWLSGNGTIDDVNFSEGYYFVNKTINGSIISQKIFVDENGTIIILTILPSIYWTDDYDIESTTSDGMLWVDYSLSFRYDDVGDEGDGDLMCYDYDYSGSFTYRECWAASASSLSACRAAYYDLDSFCSSNPTKCSTSGIISSHSLPSGQLSSKHEKTLRIIVFRDCSTSPSVYAKDADYYVVDKKRTKCPVSPSNYGVEGAYGTNSWVDLRTLNCDSTKVCDSTIAGTYNATSPTYVFSSGTAYHPCRVADGYSCINSSECLTNHSCVGGICGGNESTVDLAIVSIIPIQVIPDVDMVKDKTGYVVVNVSNTGNFVATANVSVWFEGTRLNISTNSFGFTNDNPRPMDANTSELFVFDFKPWLNGTNKVINASVEVEN